MKRRLFDIIAGAFTAPIKPSVYDFDRYENLSVSNAAQPRYSMSASLLAQGNVMMARGMIHDGEYINNLRGELLTYDFAK